MYKNDEKEFEIRRNALAEAIKNGNSVMVSPSGKVSTESEGNLNEEDKGIVVPEGVLA